MDRRAGGRDWEERRGEAVMGLGEINLTDEITKQSINLVVSQGLWTLIIGSTFLSKTCSFLSFLTSVQQIPIGDRF